MVDTVRMQGEGVALLVVVTRFTGRQWLDRRIGTSDAYASHRCACRAHSVIAVLKSITKEEPTEGDLQQLYALRLASTMQRNC